MEGVTHPLFRALMSERPGLGVLCTEFVRITDDEVAPHKLAREVVKVAGVPLSVQVMGRDVVRMAEAAKAVSDAGADIVDINLGCPSRNATKGGVGAAMLKEPKVLHQVMVAMRKNTPGLLSAKIRAGFDNAEHVVELARIVQDTGADFIAVHPRRRVDFFNGVADWRAIKMVKEALSIPVIGNGDIWYAADALRMQEQTGCDGVMMGRPALRNPWLFEQLACLRSGQPPPQPNGQDVMTYIQEVTQRYRAAMGVNAAEGKLKEILRYMLRAVNDNGVMRTQALRARTLDATVQACEGLCQLPAEALDLDAHGLLKFEQSGSASQSATAQTHAAAEALALP